MKNKNFLACAALGLLALASCSDKNDPIIDEQPILDGEQVIVLDMQDTDVLSTKSRPLYSTTNKGADLVTDVQLLVFGLKTNETQYQFVKKLPAITNWNNSSDDYAYGRKKEMKLTGGNKLSTTDYTKYIILAVGQDESDVNSIPAPFKIELGADDKYVKELADNSWTAGTSWNVASTPGNGFLKTAAIDYTAAAGKNRAGEIFSGVSTPIEFAADGGFSTTVLLKRQVAGVLGYFSRIPATVGTATGSTKDNVVTGIRLVSSNRNNSLDLSTALADQDDDTTHGQPGYKKTESVVNGFDETGTTNSKDAKFGTGAITDQNKDAYIVYEINLKDWFKWDDAQSTWHADATITGDDNTSLLGNPKGWHNALDGANSSNVVVADGAVLAGEFVIPFNKNEKNTFELQLINTTTTGDAGNTTTTVTVLKAWDVKLDPLSQGDKDGDRVYNIYRNHLYQVGKRGSGDVPTDPGTDPDKPQPLDKDQELIIKINDRWEFIHDMEIE